MGPVLARFGIHVDRLKRGERADLYDTVHPLSDDERRAIEHEIEETYREFVAVVARGRKKSVDEVEALAQGRVWTGEDAHARGLVDLLGGFDVALAEVRRRVGAGGDRLPARVVKARGEHGSTWAARPAKVPDVARLADGALGQWAGVVQVLLHGERVLLWAEEATRFGP